MSREEVGLWFTVRETAVCLPGGAGGGGGGVPGRNRDTRMDRWTENLLDAVFLCLFVFLCVFHLKMIH